MFLSIFHSVRRYLFCLRLEKKRKKITLKQAIFINSWIWKFIFVTSKEMRIELCFLCVLNRKKKCARAQHIHTIQATVNRDYSRPSSQKKTRKKKKKKPITIILIQSKDRPNNAKFMLINYYISICLRRQCLIYLFNLIEAKKKKTWKWTNRKHQFRIVHWKMACSNWDPSYMVIKFYHRHPLRKTTCAK